jgi:hypothetical protein
MTTFSVQQQDTLESIVRAMRALAVGVTEAVKRAEVLRLALERYGVITNEQWTRVLAEWEAAHAVESALDPGFPNLGAVFESLVAKIRA